MEVLAEKNRRIDYPKLTSMLIMFVGLIYVSGIALGQELPPPPKDAPWFVTMMDFVLEQFPEINAWFAAVMVMAMGVLRAVSELLNFIAARTETKTDDMIAAYVSQLLRWLSAIVGWFGLGAPKK